MKTRGSLRRVATIALGATGIPTVAYGMATHNNPVFLIGLGLVIGFYVLIRERLKQRLGKN